MKLAIYCALTAFIASFAFLRILIPILRKLKAGQNILSYVKEHREKGGTPTMGGLAFVLATVFSLALFLHKFDRVTAICLLIGVSYMIVGLLDDGLKKKRKENLGLRAWQKLLFQTLLALFSGIYCYRTGRNVLNIPFTDKTWEIGAWILPLSVFVFIATVNAVNLTDGLDGLAAGVSFPFFLFFGFLLALQGEKNLQLIAFALVGALGAYLLFNVHPAAVFMGDTGSLALGGFASSISVFSGNALYLPVVGCCFVFSVISVLLQVIYYKATGGKRIFLMSPAHHHFQEKGYSENRIAFAYAIVTALVGAFSLALLLE